jgi:ABC-type multidrug transport system fused ATPase/permease subunit
MVVLMYKEKFQTFKMLKKTYNYAKNKKKNLIYFFIGCIFSCVISAVSPLLWAKELLCLTSGDFHGLFYFALISFGIEILRNIVYFVDNRNIQIFFHSARTNIQLTLAGEILKTSMNDLNQESSGVFIQRITDDCRSLAEVFVDMIDYLTYILTNIGILVSIFFLSKIIFLFYVIFLLILFYFQKIKVTKWKENDKKRREISEKATGFVGELVRGCKDIKILNAEDSMLKEANNKLLSLNNANWYMFKINRIYTLIIGNIRDILDLIFIFLSIFLIKQNSLSIATCLIIYSYQNNILSLTDYIERIQQIIKKFNLSAERVFEIIDGKTVKKESFGSKHLKHVNGDFEFKHVNFSYEDNIPILKDISFKIHANETVSFVGKSGAGKTTIFNLLARLYDPINGEIELDGINIKELDKDSLRGNISIISQNPYIFNMSIRDNLRLVKDKLTEAEMIEACKTACLHDYIMSLPDKYDTIVGEGGITLSGGQRQRLAIARALVQKTEIILFDEATSALDNETQASIQQAIQNMKGEYTILIIAHRLSTVIHSDRLLLIDDGKVIAEGTHKELMESNIEYQNLYKLEENN